MQWTRVHHFRSQRIGYIIAQSADGERVLIYFPDTGDRQWRWRSAFPPAPAARDGGPGRASGQQQQQQRPGRAESDPERPWTLNAWRGPVQDRGAGPTQSAVLLPRLSGRATGSCCARRAASPPAEEGQRSPPPHGLLQQPRTAPAEARMAKRPRWIRHFGGGQCGDAGGLSPVGSAGPARGAEAGGAPVRHRPRGVRPTGGQADAAERREQHLQRNGMRPAQNVSRPQKAFA